MQIGRETINSRDELRMEIKNSKVFRKLIQTEEQLVPNGQMRGKEPILVK